ncbi:MAG: hypothetical protein HY706_14460 [Candidatus Hydrogenedentes bacterium]|nr:hypothetical protein [Candidatus Hydrogenedentota bacterium]
MGKPHKSTVVSLIIVIVAAGAGISIFFRILNTPVAILPPESAEVAAKRQASDNAFFALEEAAKTQIPAPTALVQPSPDKPAEKVAYTPKPDSAARLLEVFRPDDDPSFRAYIEAHAPALAKIHEALHKPYYLCPELGGFATKTDYLGGFTRLGKLLCARAMIRARAGGQEAAAMEDWLDCIRLGRLVGSDGAVMNFAAGAELQRIAFSRVPQLARDLTDAEVLRNGIEQLIPLIGYGQDTAANLEFGWRQLDLTPNIPISAAHLATGEGPVNKLLGRLSIVRARWYIRSLRVQIRDNHDLFLEGAKLSLPEFVKWKEAHAETLASDHHILRPLDELMRLVVTRAERDARGAGVQLALALELYRKQQGNYPDAIESLKPVCLQNLPTDPFSGAAFIYRRAGDDYALYSVGENGQDDGGTELRRLDTVIHTYAEPAGAA